MKKAVCILMSFVFLVTAFSGCTKEVEETISPYITDLMDSLPPTESLPDCLIAETDRYTFSRIDGICYLSFKSGNYQIEYNEHEAGQMTIDFKSLDALQQWLKKPIITEKYENIIRKFFTLDGEKGFILPDPDCLYTIEGYTVNDVSIRSSSYTLSFVKSENNDMQNSSTFYMEFCRENVFRKRLSRHYAHKVNTCNNDHHHDEYQKNNISYVEYTNDLGSRQRFEYYIFQEENKTIFVSEQSCIGDSENPSVSPESPVLRDTNALGYHNGAYFSLWTYCKDKQTEREAMIDLIQRIEIVHYDSAS